MFKTGNWYKRGKFLVKTVSSVSFARVLFFVQGAFERRIKKIESANFFK